MFHSYRFDKGGALWLPLVLILSSLVLATALCSRADARSVELKRTHSPKPENRSRDAESTEAPTEGSLPAGTERFEQSFPHLLVDRSPRKPEHLRVAPGVTVRRGNAHVDPNGVMPPAVLSKDRYDRASRLMNRAADPEAFSAELRDAARLGQAEPDTQRILVLRVDFLNDSVGSKTTGNGRFDLRDSTNVVFDPPPHNRTFFERHMDALLRYYDAQTRGSLVLEYDVFPSETDSAYHLPDTFDYGPWIFSNNNPDVLQHAIDLVGDSLVEADEDGEIDFGRYEHFLLFHAGADFQGDINRDSPWDIPSFNLFVVEPFVVQDSIGVNFVMVVPETVTQDEFTGALNGVVAHEFGHQLGFADLYDVRNGLSVVGAFSLMDSGDNQFALVEDPAQPGRNLAVRGTLPASVDPFHKLFVFPESVDLVDVDEVLDGEETSFEVDLDAVQLDNEIIFAPLNYWEYFLIENRHLDLNADSTVIIRQDPETGVILGPEPDSTAMGDSLAYLEYDWLLPGEGVIVWHVDWLAINTGTSTPGGGVNIFFSRPGVAVVEADGIRDLGTASSEFLGGPYDPFFKGGYNTLSPFSTPSSNTNDATATGFTMTVQDTIGIQMRVRIETELQPVGWPIRTLPGVGEEQLLALDVGLGHKDVIVPGIDGRESILLRVEPGGENAFVFARLEGEHEFGLAGREDFIFPGADGPEAAIAAVGNGQLHLLRPDDAGQVGRPDLVWPSFNDPRFEEHAVTTTPVLMVDNVLVGCEDGFVRNLRVDDFGPLASEVRVADSPVGAIGFAVRDDDFRVFWASEGGEIGAYDALDASDAWDASSAVGADRGAPVGPIALERPDTGELEYLFAWSGGHLEWRGTGGELREGWPISIDQGLVHAPLLADLDLDGELETVVADSAGYLHAFNPNGVEDIGWPISIWSEDRSSRSDLRSAPKVLDINGDETPEILVHRGDGFLLAFDGEGQPVPGFPLSFGLSSIHGPHWIEGDGDVAPRLLVGNLEGFTTDGLPVELMSVVRVPESIAGGMGHFPFAGVDRARTRFYPPEWTPEARSASSSFDDLRLYPNPLRGEDLKVHFVLGEEATLRFDAYDLSGKRVAQTEFTGRAGAQGNQFEWDLSSLVPGVYQVRVRVESAGFTSERFEKIAVVR